MIDLKFLRENADVVRESQRARGEDPTLVDQLLEADEARRSSIQAADELRSEQKAFGKKIGQAAPEDRPALLEGSNELKARVKEAEAAQAQAEEAVAKLQYRISNVIEGAPAGGEEDFVVLEHAGEIPEFDFEVRDHLDLAEGLGIIDVKRGTKVSGARFYYLVDDGAWMQLGMLMLAAQKAREAGFKVMIPPVLVRPEVMQGTGFLDAHDEEIYYLERDDMYLVGTSEVALAGYHADEILDLRDGPLRYAATSTCYRREAGSYGKDTRGIFRVHQFQKTEMFVFCRPEDAQAQHEELLRIERRILEALELPYRVIDVAAGDLGGPASRKYDCEAWVPTQGKYRELTSTSNCTTFQARRLNIRERNAEGGGTRTVATLNGTAITSTRPIVAILENHQQADGSVRVPAALQPFLGAEVIRPR